MHAHLRTIYTMNWKDYFYFSKSQRVGLIVVIIAILAVSIANLFLDKLITRASTQKDLAFEQEVAQFKSSLEDNTPHFEKYKHKNYYSHYPKQQYKQYQTKTIILFPFNPNTLDSSGFVQLGLKPFQAKNILKFRAKGGKFRKTEDFSKVYGLSTEQFTRLKPFIQIPAEQKTNKIETAVLVDLNSADTSQLMQVKGIYPSLAKRIIAYGKKLGGYVKHEQLKEITGIQADIIERINPSLRIDASRVQAIAINKASIDRLRAHPYINFYQAKAIYEYRRNHGKVKSLAELKQIEEDCFNEEFWRKVQPYFEFGSHY